MHDLDPAKVATVLGDKQLVISYTLLKNMEACPRQAFLSLAVDRRLRRDNSADVIGPSAAHDMFEKWVDTGQWEAGWMRRHVEAAFAVREQRAALLEYRKNVSQKGAEWGMTSDREYQLEKARRAVDALEQFAFERDLMTHHLEAERWVSVQIPALPRFRLVGAMDLWDGTMKVIYDIKVTDNTSYGDPHQLVFYALLHYYVTGVLPRHGAFFYPLAPPEKRFVPVTVDQQAVTSLTDRIKNFVGAFSTLDFPAQPKTTNECFRCGYKSFCPRFGGAFGVTRSSSPLKIGSLNVRSRVPEGSSTLDAPATGVGTSDGETGVGENGS